MPTYQYRCTDCGQDLEAVQKFTDTALTECPSCGGSLRKIFNAVGVVFKGSGFYRTDSRVNGNGKDSAEKSESTGNAEKSESGKSESDKSSRADASAKSEKPGAGKSSAGKSETSGKSDTAGGSKQPAGASSTGNSS